MEKAVHNARLIRFATFEVDLQAGEVHKGGLRLKLSGQPFQVLAILLEQPGAVVTREELQKRLWPDTFVDVDHNLNTAINKIREVLGDSAENPRFVETLPRRGYRFIYPMGGETATTSSKLRWKIVVPAAAILIALVAGGLYWYSHKSAKLTEKDAIVLADFTNTTGESVFDGALKQGLSAQLEQSPFLNLLSDDRVRRTLRLMGRSPDERLTQQVARAVCQRTESTVVVTGSISNIGSHYAVGLNAVNCQSGDFLATEQVEASQKEEVLKALDRAGTRLRERLGESLSSIQKFDAPIEEATTPSLEALKAFSQGDAQRARGKEADAIPLFKHAIELDPNFAMAYAKLAHIYESFGERTLAAEPAKKARDLEDRVSELERFYIDSGYYYLTGELEKRIETYQVWQQTYPRDWNPRNNLAFHYILIGKFDQAIEEAREAIRLNPDHAFPYGILGWAYLWAGRYDEAKATIEAAKKKGVDGVRCHVVLLTLAMIQGDTAEIQRQAAWGRGTPYEGSMLFHKAEATAFFGKLTESRRLFREAVEKETFKEGAAGYVAAEAWIEADTGNYPQARQQASKALAISRGPFVKVQAATALAASGDAKQAQGLARELAAQFPKDTLINHLAIPCVAGEIELQNGNPAHAVELVAATPPYDSGARAPLYLRGQAFLQLHEGEEAAAEFQKILAHKGGFESSWPFESPWLFPLARLGMARALVLQGDAPKARAAYQDFLTLWKDADRDIPILKQAKAEYSRLQ